MSLELQPRGADRLRDADGRRAERAALEEVVAALAIDRRHTRALLALVASLATPAADRDLAAADAFALLEGAVLDGKREEIEAAVAALEDELAARVARARAEGLEALRVEERIDIVRALVRALTRKDR